MQVPQKCTYSKCSTWVHVISFHSWGEQMYETHKIEGQRCNKLNIQLYYQTCNEDINIQSV